MAREHTEQQIDRYNRFGKPVEWLMSLCVGLVSGGATFINVTRTKFHDDGKFRQGSAIIHDVKGKELRVSWNKMLDATHDQFAKTLGKDKYFKAFMEARDNIMEASTKTAAVDPRRFNTLETEWITSLQELLEHRRDKMMAISKTPEFQKTVKQHLGDAGKVKGKYDHLGDDFNELFLGVKSHGIVGHTQGAWQRLKNFSHYANRNVLIKTAAAVGAGFGVTMMVFNQLNSRDKLNEIDKQTERSDRKIDAIAEKIGVVESEIKTRKEHKESLKLASKLESTHAAKPNLHVMAEGRRHDGMQRDVAHEASL